MDALRVEKISKDFGGIRALNDVSFHVGIGERLAIIGPNGAGKTTFFNVLNGQLKASSGKVFFFGKDVTGLPPFKKAQMGMSRSFQLTTLFPGLSVFENALIAYQGVEKSRFQAFRSIYSYKTIVNRTKDILGTMGLWDKRNQIAGAIAYGEQRKLEIALSLASMPKLLLLDEPNCGMTTEESRDIIERINDLKKDITILLVAHDMELVFGVADRIIVLHYGEVMAEGSCDEIKCDEQVKECYMGTQEVL